MTYFDKISYKYCREAAGFTQEQAAPLLHIGVRTLSSYETGTLKTPDDIVDAMVRLYQTPILAWWHMKQGILGKYLPDTNIPSDECAMTLDLILAGDELGEAITDMKEIMADGQIDQYEMPRAHSIAAIVEKARSRLASASLHFKEFLQQYSKAA